MRLPVNGEEISVPSTSHLKCPKCGEIVLRFHDARRLHEDTAAIYRKRHGLLPAAEIRAMPRKPMNALIATAAAEKAATTLTVEYLKKRGQRADPQLFDRIMRRVPAVPPVPGDERLPKSGARRRARKPAGS